MNVSVIIVNYNTGDLLIDCINSIEAQTRGVSYECIIVDNKSPQNCKDKILKNFPHIKWIQNDENVGFGRANNVGAACANGKYLFFLNADTILLNDALTDFYKFMEHNDPDNKIYGAIGAHLLNKELKPNVSGSLFLSPFDTLKYLYFSLCNKVLKHKLQERIEYVIGADMFISKENFEKIGGFDKDYFMYCEEADLQLRLYQLGLKNILISSPQIIHLEGGSFGESQGITLKRYYMWQKSIKIYTSKHFNIFQKIGWKINQAIFGIPVILKQDWSIPDKLKAYIYSIK